MLTIDEIQNAHALADRTGLARDVLIKMAALDKKLIELRDDVFSAAPKATRDELIAGAKELFQIAENDLAMHGRVQEMLDAAHRVAGGLHPYEKTAVTAVVNYLRGGIDRLHREQVAKKYPDPPAPAQQRHATIVSLLQSILH